MAKVDYQELAKQILERVGGAGNVAGATHCITRLRLKIRDMSKVDKSGIEAMEGVITVVEAGGQFQVVIGDNVPTVYTHFTNAAGIASSAPVEEDEEKGNLFNRFVNMISKIFSPFLWTLAGTGLLKAFLALATTLNWMDPLGQNYTILNAAADSTFYFLPLMLAVTSARYFKANQFTALAIAGALVYPSIIALNDAGEPVHFLGIPVVMMSYVSSVIPIIFAVWMQSHLEKLLSKLPAMIRNFSVPLFSVLIMVPLTLMVVGPITMTLSGWISSGVNALFEFAPWLGGAAMGGLWQVLVIFGMHWSFVPIMVNDLAVQGYSLLSGPLPAAVLAQAAAGIAVFIRTRSKKRRQVAGPAAVSGVLAGVTEPLVYGVNLPMRLPFFFGIAGGAIGGTIAAIGGSASDVFAIPSLIALPTYLNVGSFAMQVIGIVVGMVVAFTLTLFFGVNKKNDQPDDAPGAPAAEAAIPDDGAGVQPVESESAATTAKATAVGTLVKIAAPVAGELVPVSEVKDKVFASGALGSGVGVVPAEATVVSPVSGTVATVFPTGHAYGIKTADGVEVLVHIGIDTVSMNGDGFEAKVAKGESVEAGQPLAVVDFDKVREAGYDPTVIVVVTNTKKLASVAPVAAGSVVAGDASIAVEI
ncbi:beta-glucoside-specific PTS transporter subunit IIABC [Actinomycetaceae bacterium L2_0104]